ncbi:MAG: ankyrin repeat domain-containing protein [Pirellulaceae bacterium]
MTESTSKQLNQLLDFDYGADGDQRLRLFLSEKPEAANSRWGERDETPLHVAARRRRCSAIEILLAAGANVDAVTAGGKTAFAHAVRRGFDDVAAILIDANCDQKLAAADQFAVAVVLGRLDEAKKILESANVARTGNPEEDRLLADVAGRSSIEAVRFLIDAGADLTARGLMMNAAAPSGLVVSLITACC